MFHSSEDQHHSLRDDSFGVSCEVHLKAVRHNAKLIICMHPWHGAGAAAARGSSRHLLDEDLAQAALPEGIVLEIEAVEAVEGVLVRVHVQRVHVEVVPARVIST